MAVPVDGQLLLLSQPVEGPVPEPIVLGPAQKLDILLDAPDPVSGLSESCRATET